MTKKFSAFFLIVAFISSASCLQAVEFLTEGKVAYFRPTDKKFRRIYHGGMIYGLEGSCQTWENLYTFAGVSYFNKSGHSIGEHDHTRIQFVPVSLGLKYLSTCINHVDLYVGAGALATYLHIKDDSPFVVRKSIKWGFGGIFKVGAYTTIGDSFFFDFFADYSLMTVHIHNRHHKVVLRHDAKLSGLSAGVGLGFKLGCK